LRRQDFGYELPEALIAQAPLEPRDRSRLLVLDRRDGSLTDAIFRDLPGFLRPGDVLVSNDTRVLPARLRARKDTGAAIEALLVGRESADVWEALLRPGKRVRPGMRLTLPQRAWLDVIEDRGDGVFGVRLGGEGEPEAILHAVGEVPLPPYIRREQLRAEDVAWYQTLFADPDKGGSAAAPTAGLHFTPEVLAALDAKGVERATVTLHVGLGTFLPIRVEDLSTHRMHRERFEVSEATAQVVNRALDEGRRVVAVGTTTTRVLEHAGASGRLSAGAGFTELFVLPGYTFRIVGALVTNFHLPESTLLMLVSALGGTERVLAAYRHAVAQGYRFFSYGDAMLIQ
jgi:S-adenosylmethionine:tRNA ribosyltransferase-isomerase